ncbi:uncharacterized protein [Leptinotarsa decemlineata]|uniref:uncharacterized protein n=1 Tax=Leptinotarsa decemlineata TaxID=7539 RepID=UPI003D309727
MPRTFKKTTDRTFPEGDLQQAVEDILNNHGSLRQVAAARNVTKSRLALYVKKAKEKGSDNVSFKPNFHQRKVFSDQMEKMLADYLLHCSKMFYGMTPKKCRQIAYQFAEANDVKVPNSWEENQQAGEDWFTGFMKRNSTLSIRKPEATSLARMTAFNKTTVGEFFDKLHEVINRNKYRTSNIFNLDETGVTTVPPVTKVIAQKGEKQIGQVTSRERGELVTQVGIICANGNCLPPVFIFPRARFDKTKMMAGAAPGALGLVHKSGWMTTDNFILVLKFFKDNVRCDKEHPVLLLMDNHESHLSLEAINFCRDNGITILTLPPHTSNRLQPLDRSVFGPFKKYFSNAVHSWMLDHPNQTLTIYSLPELCSRAWDRAATPENVKAGFQKCGISPFDRNIFQDHDFLCSAVSDRPCPSSDPLIPSNSLKPTESSTDLANGINAEDPPSTIINSTEAHTPIASCSHHFNNNNLLSGSFVSPEQLIPYPKAKPRKLTKGGRKRGKCMIATDTPEKEEIEDKSRSRLAKKSKAVKNVFQGDKTDSSDEDMDEVILKDSSSEMELDDESDECLRSGSDAVEGDFLVVKVPSEKGRFAVNFVAKVEQKLLDGLHVQFYKRTIPSNRFRLTNEASSFITFSQVITILPKPIEDNRARFKGMLYFNTDISGFYLQ